MVEQKEPDECWNLVKNGDYIFDVENGAIIFDQISALVWLLVKIFPTLC